VSVGWKENFLKLMKNGDIPILLSFTPTVVSRERFDDWTIFASNKLIEKRLGYTSRSAAKELRLSLDRDAVKRLATRLILSKSSGLIRHLETLWIVFGSSGETCRRLAKILDDLVENWPCQLVDCRHAIDGIEFSSAVSKHTEAMIEIVNSDRDGILGQSIPLRLFIEGAITVEFPIVDVDAPSEVEGLRRDFSVQLTTACHQVVPDPKVPELEIAWNLCLTSVSECIQDFVRKPVVFRTPQQGTAFENDGPVETFLCLDSPVLPPWLINYNATSGGNIADFSSAGLSVAISAIKGHSDKLPYGLAFSGAWHNGFLHPVRSINRKMIAASDSGCILFFACIHADELSGVKPPPGLQVVALPDGGSLQDIIRIINYGCAASGLTDFRSLAASGIVASNGFIEQHASVNLPNIEEALPVGFVGRTEDVEQLKCQLLSHPDKLLAVIAPPGSGKSSLLGNVFSGFKLMPVWYSINSSEQRSRYLRVLRESLSQSAN
jgi:hypothetical protein